MGRHLFLSFGRSDFTMRKIFVLLVLASRISANAQITLSDKAEISVITCGPGQNELYSAFGHSAFRVNDPVNGFDYAFNYGVFDFNQPNFYLNFARGHNYYKLAVQDYRQFEYFYIYYNRYVHEQVLNLTAWQKQRLFDFLQWNARPGNERYLYDYFYDNCATKLPEIMTKVFGDSVVFDGSYITTAYTIRQLTDRYLKHQPWGDLGIDICLGLPMDKKATPYEYMFLPDYVESGFDHARLNGKPLVSEKKIVYEALPENRTQSLFRPLYVFIFLALITLAITFRDYKRKRISNWFDAFLFGSTGLIGLLLFLLWVATDHKAAANNLNLLWALPSHLAAAFLLFKTRSWMITYFYGVLLLNSILLLTWAWLPQQLHVALIPVVIMLLLRSLAQSYLKPPAT